MYILPCIVDLCLRGREEKRYDHPHRHSATKWCLPLILYIYHYWLIIVQCQADTLCYLSLSTCCLSTGGRGYWCGWRVRGPWPIREWLADLHVGGGGVKIITSSVFWLQKEFDRLSNDRRFPSLIYTSILFDPNWHFYNVTLSAGIYMVGAYLKFCRRHK